MPKFDIFILSYNRADYLEETLLSFKAQTCQNFCLRILDNGSTDTSAAIAEKYDVPFLTNSSNQGAFKNFMRIRDLATADWVMAFHDDDLLHPRYLEQVAMQLAKHPGCRVIGSAYEGNLSPNREIFSQRAMGEGAWHFKNAAHFGSFLFTLNEVNFASVIYHRDGFMAIEEDYSRFGKMWDRPVLLDACAGGEALVFKEPYVCYRLHQGQDSQSPDSGPFLDEAIALTGYYKEIMGSGLGSSSGRSFVVNNRAYLKGLYKWCSDRGRMSFNRFVARAYRDKAATPAVFLPRPLMRLVKKTLKRIDADFF